MEQHPIPQDVTGSQFKLIGTMTVKQFGFVAIGAIAAVVVYYLPLKFPLAFLVKMLLIPFFGGAGVVVAFVPIEGRPIDVMATHFFNAIFSPNQYVYIKLGKKLSFNKITITHQPTATQTTQTPASSQKTDQKTKTKEQQLQAILFSANNKPRSTLDEKEMSFLKSISNIPVPHPQPAIIHKPSLAPVSPAPAPKPLIPTSKPQPQQTKILKPTPPPPNTPQPSSHPAIQPLNNEVIKQSIPPAKPTPATVSTSIPQPPNNPPMSPPPPLLQPTTYNLQPNPIPSKPIPQNLTQKAGLPHVSDTPNVIVGIVKDPRGNVLPNILVEVKDKEGNPVRAFKTNPLGQFASATPLSQGTYTIELEDPKAQQKFDIVQITAKNEILLPIEITSHDAREQLRKELFS